MGRPGLMAARWAELVWHVLAHVRSSASVAASVYDRRYVAFVERGLGSAAGRSLAEDARLLGEIAPSHETLARLQLLAWLFLGIERAQALGARGLAELEDREVDDPTVLGALPEQAELLWCACLLEAPAFQKLPPPELDPDALVRELERAKAWAPGLAECRVELLRPLCRRGRVRGDTIWVGVPDSELGVSADHVVWQASHEATVRELGRGGGRAVAEREVEHAAVVLLAERARAAGAMVAHARWLAHFGDNAPSIERAALSDAARGLIERV